VKNSPKLLRVVLPVALLFGAMSAHATNITVNCPGKTPSVEIAKLSKTVANTATLSGACVDNLVLSHFVDLTIVGAAGSTFTSKDITIPAINVRGGKVTLQNTNVSSGGTGNGIVCDNRSYCLLTSVNVQNGGLCVYAQGKSSMDIVGTSQIHNCSQGVGAYGGSDINLRPVAEGLFDPTLAGETISNNTDTGLWCQDGSFVRSDNSLITGNGNGVAMSRNCTVKLFDYDNGLNNGGYVGGVISNTGVGVSVQNGSILQSIAVVNNNGTAYAIGDLSEAQVSIAPVGNTTDLSCTRPTSVARGTLTCP
jgi:hypothetical protein